MLALQLSEKRGTWCPSNFSPGPFMSDPLIWGFPTTNSHKLPSPTPHPTPTFPSHSPRFPFSKILAIDLTSSFTEKLVIDQLCLRATPHIYFPYLIPVLYKTKITKIDSLSSELELNMIQETSSQFKPESIRRPWQGKFNRNLIEISLNKPSSKIIFNKYSIATIEEILDHNPPSPYLLLYPHQKFQI